MAEDLKDTLNLPKTDFPMRANLVEREPKRIEQWEGNRLYEKIQEKNKNNDAYVLHDGPPFTNGDVHIGTALNKILKDVILRYKSMRGFRTPYIPGWDCHGLPIEYKVAQALQKKKKQLGALALREACADFSREYMAKQRTQFKRLGVLADWAHEYKTMDPAYEAEVLRVFATIVDCGLVYRSKKPVYWSIPCKTALAEFEVEYKDHTSPSVYVKFPFKDAAKLGLGERASIVIWTTTPWTLPSNLAIALHPELDYQAIEWKGETLIVAEKLASAFIDACKLEGATLGKTIKGTEFEKLEARHPFIDRPSVLVLADYVTTDAGTGCVHTAPGHGPDDYYTALKCDLEIYSPLDDKGCYIDDGRIPKDLVGLSVLDKGGKSAANEGVLKIIEGNKTLLHKEALVHQYPHCWRSKTPVVFRAMDQWFVSLDAEDTRKKVLKAIEGVEWIPEWSKARMIGAVNNRPDWCISRQRAWGTPLPVFYNEDGKALLDGGVIRGIADKVEKAGTNIWFKESAEALLAGVKLPSEFEGKALEKGQDTLDVWIDSGSSHRMLESIDSLQWPADLYFEGSDQHRGWFQSSLWTSIITKEVAPYKRVMTHGFVVNEQKRKISKSDKKPQNADAYVNKYGADIMRLWICSEDYRTDVPISDGILKHIVQTYRTIRNTLRFQLGNLYDFDFEKNAVDVDVLTAVDKWALHQAAILIGRVTEAYESYQFHKVYQELNRFCTTTLSASYHDILKDRLYTYGPDWKERRSSQTTIYLIFRALVRLLAPILAFTAEEAFLYSNKDTQCSSNLSIHLTNWVELEPRWKNQAISDEIDTLFKIRDKVNEQLEQARQRKELGQSLDAKVCIQISDDNEFYKILKKYEAFLAEFFIVSQVSVLQGKKKNNEPVFDISIKHAEGVRCPRSWRWVPKLVPTEMYGEVSERCLRALQEKYPKS